MRHTPSYLSYPYVTLCCMAGRDSATSGVALWALIAATTVVAAVTFVLSFAGLVDYATRVAGIPRHLAWLVPVGVDGLTLCCIAATHLLRHATWWVRIYVWAVFGVAVAASVAGNVSHAASRGLTYQGMVGNAAWPIGLALATHLLVVVRRHTDTTDATSDASNTTETPGSVAPTRRRAKRRAPKRDMRHLAVKRHGAGESITAVARDIGVHRATVARWTKETTS